MTFKKTTAVCLAAMLLCTSLASCKSGGEDSEGNLPVTAETVESIANELQTDHTENAETAELLSLLKNSFADLPESPAEDFKITVADGKVTVTDYLGSAEAVRIPAEIDGQAVVAISDAAFAQKTSLKKLYIPDGVTSLGTGILKDCTSLEALRTPILGVNAQSEQYLGYLFGAEQHEDNARDVPAGLQYLELGGNMAAVPDYALFDCNDLVLVTLPNTVKTIGTYSLYNCRSLLALNTENLTSVSEHALDSCSSLTRLEFGEVLTSIGFGALEGCGGIRYLQLPFVGGSADENTYLGYLFGAAAPDFSKGYYPSYLTEVSLLSSCSSIGNYAFYECESLERVKLQEGVASIGVRAFAECVRLESLALPDSVTILRENAFFGCLSLQSVCFGADSALQSVGVNAFYNCGQLKQIALPQLLKALPASCFAGCVSLEEIDLGGVTSVGKNAFRHCNALTKLTAVDGVAFEDGNECAENLLETAKK